MRPLIWKRIKQGTKGNVSGFLILLFILWTPFILQEALESPGYPESRVTERVYVQITGDIEFPGVYDFIQEPDLPELISRGGGLKGGSGYPGAFDETALRSGVRIMVRKLADGWAYDKEQLSAFHKVTLGIPLSLNRESEDGLTAVPGIGPGLAERIVRRRDDLGGFKNIHQIKSVHGIGEKRFQKITRYITLP